MQKPDRRIDIPSRSSQCMPTRDTMRHASETIRDPMGLTVAFHTKGTQGTLHKTGIKKIMARQGLS